MTEQKSAIVVPPQNNQNTTKQKQNEANKEIEKHPGLISQKQIQLQRPSAQSKINEGMSSDQHRDLSRSINKHKDSIVLPQIPHKMNYGDRIFEKQSASTLQKTIVAYSMPKANRFNNDPKYTGEPSYCLDSCFKPNPTKGVGFGFGGKRQFPAWMEKNMKQNPPPGAYIDTNKEIKNAGRTFGISHKYYQKVLIPKQKQQTYRKLSPLNEK